MFVFDTETTGLPSSKTALTDFVRLKRENKVQYFNSARLVQFAGILYDKEFNELERLDMILRPDDFQVRETNVHGITHHQAIKEGIPFSAFGQILGSLLPKIEMVIGHNVMFDVAVVVSELIRHNSPDRVWNTLLNKPRFCSMAATKGLVGLRTKVGGIKLPSLSELYQFAHRREYDAETIAHNALYDSLNLASSLKCLVLDGLLEIPGCQLAQSRPQETRSLRLPTKEQVAVVEASHRSNVIVDAVAGSGKTTTILELYKSWQTSTSAITILTYNKALQLETEERLGEPGIVFTYHGFANRLFGSRPLIRNDVGLSTAISSRHPHCLPCRLLVIDEAQDMTPILYRFICCFLATFKEGRRPTLVLLGDFQQCVYRFADARPQFLAQADILFGSFFPGCSWERQTLSTSFRFGPTIASFLNAGVLSEPRLTGGFEIPGKVDYITANTYGSAFHAEILKMVQDEPEKWMILAPYLLPRNNTECYQTPVAVLTDYLAGKVPCYISQSSGGKDMTLAKNKLLFLTYVRSKGLERDNVIVLGFDAGLSTLQGRQLDACDSSFYVACTRARKRLVLVRSNRAQELAFLQLDRATRFFQHHVINEPKIKLVTPKPVTRNEFQLTDRAPLNLQLEVKDIMEAVGDNGLGEVEIPLTAAGVKDGLEDISGINPTAFALIVSEDLSSNGLIDIGTIRGLLAIAVDQWTKLVQTRYLKKQLSKPYSWISPENLAEIRGLFEQRLEEDFAATLHDCHQPDSRSLPINVDEIEVAIGVGQSVLLLPNSRYLLIITEELSEAHVLRLLVHVWVDKAESDYFIYSFANDSLYHLPINFHSQAERLVQELTRASLKDHSKDDPLFVQSMLKLV